MLKLVIADTRRYIEERQGWAKFSVSGQLSAVAGRLSQARAEQQLAGYSVEATSLEDIFLHITSSAQHQAAA
jgi:hypothetical protein